ncbi:MAG: hypothetical protein H7Y11_06485 [Armatimonadetes bacterium]|nr:hypothetical protein [Anaerolineae bacterium]
MATAANTAASGAKARPSSVTGYPEGGLRFDWAMTALSALFLGGLWVDGWAHFHDKTDTSFFTPWHFVFYGAFGAVGLFLGYHQVRNVTRGYGFARALPAGYWLSLVGAAIFALSGVGDMVWHTLFGIEGGTEALMSPTHIGLSVGMGLVFTGALRATLWRARQMDVPLRGWRNLGPAIVSAALLLSLLWFFTSYANPIGIPLAAKGMGGRFAQDEGVTGLLLSSAMLSGIMALLAWRWRLPFGAYTLLFSFSTALMTVLNDFYLLIPPAIIAGIVVDVLATRLQPSRERTGQFILLLLLAPMVYFGSYFGALALVAGIGWSVHVWTGSIVIAGFIGGLIGGLIIATSTQ